MFLRVYVWCLSLEIVMLWKKTWWMRVMGVNSGGQTVTFWAQHTHTYNLHVRLGDQLFGWAVHRHNFRLHVQKTWDHEAYELDTVIVLRLHLGLGQLHLDDVGCVPVARPFQSVHEGLEPAGLMRLPDDGVDEEVRGRLVAVGHLLLPDPLLLVGPDYLQHVQHLRHRDELAQPRPEVFNETLVNVVAAGSHCDPLKTARWSQDCDTKHPGGLAS